MVVCESSARTTDVADTVEGAGVSFFLPNKLLNILEWNIGWLECNESGDECRNSSKATAQQ